MYGIKHRKGNEMIIYININLFIAFWAINYIHAERFVECSGVLLNNLFEYYNFSAYWLKQEAASVGSDVERADQKQCQFHHRERLMNYF